MLVSEHSEKELKTKLFRASVKKAKLETIKVLRKVRKAILANPKEFVMSDWIEDVKKGEVITDYLPHDQEAHFKAPACGTTACIGGHALLVTKKGRSFLKFDGNRVDYSGVDVASAARDVLDINEDQSSELFYTGDWPDIFQDAFAHTHSAKERVTVAANRIESFIEELR